MGEDNYSLGSRVFHMIGRTFFPANMRERGTEGEINR